MIYNPEILTEIYVRATDYYFHEINGSLRKVVYFVGTQRFELELSVEALNRLELRVLSSNFYVTAKYYRPYGYMYAYNNVTH